MIASDNPIDIFVSTIMSNTKIIPSSICKEGLPSSWDGCQCGELCTETLFQLTIKAGTGDYELRGVSVWQPGFFTRMQIDDREV